MHMISKKDLNDAEMDTLTKSCRPTTVITANGEVQTHEEATVCVELKKFLTMKVLENTPAVLSLGKLCDENGYFQGHLQDMRVIVLHLLQARLRHRQQHQVIMRLEKERIELKVILLPCLCQVFNVDDRTGTPVVCRESNHEQSRQANQKHSKTHKKEYHARTGTPVVCRLRSRKF